MPSFAVWVGLLCSAGFWPSFGDDPLERRFPVEAEGDLHFHADAAYFWDGVAPVLDLAISIPSIDLAMSEAPAESLALAAEMLDAGGNVLARYATRVVIPADTARVLDADDLSWIRVRPAWVAGTEGLRLRVEDLGALKLPLFERMKKHHLEGEAAARLEIPRRPGGVEPRLSGLLFVRGTTQREGEGAATGLRTVRDRLEPHPRRLYGRDLPAVSFYWERYPSGRTVPGRDTLSAPGLEFARYEIWDRAESLLVREREETLRAAPDPSWELKRFDVRDLPAGTYDLRLETYELVASRRVLLGHTEGAFQVVWDAGRMQDLDDRHLTAYARLILPAEEFLSFVDLDRGSREAYLRSLWDRLDPTPPGKPNPTEAKFYGRIAEVERQYGGWPRAVRSDRGRVYVRLGAPDVMSHNLNPQDEELLWRVLPGEVGNDSDSFEVKERLSRHRTPLDNAAYEIWEYHSRGEPLAALWSNPGNQMGLKFIFVDEAGTGDFALVYTNLVGGMQ